MTDFLTPSAGFAALLWALSGVGAFAGVVTTLTLASDALVSTWDRVRPRSEAELASSQKVAELRVKEAEESRKEAEARREEWLSRAQAARRSYP